VTGSKEMVADGEQNVSLDFVDAYSIDSLRGDVNVAEQILFMYCHRTHWDT